MPEGVAFCPRCGSRQAAEAAFCWSCGLDLRTIAAPAQRGAEAPYTHHPAPPAGPLAPLVYVGFWKRLGAAVIDGVLVGIVNAIIIAIIGQGESDRENLSTGTLVAVYTVPTVLGWLYYAGLESSVKQGTVGKMALGIAVTDRMGERITFMRATGRYFAKIVSFLTLLIGYLMIGWTEKKQGLHDMMADTLVVKR